MSEAVAPFEAGADEFSPFVQREGNEYVLRSRIRLPHAREKVFPFFAEARNLEQITPSTVKFEVLTPDPIEMRVDARIEYKLKIKMFPVYWRTRITVWNPPESFEDVQEKGPYKQWIHQHVFLDEGETTLMDDIVRYRVPLGRIMNYLMVQRDVLGIFRYRQQAIRKIFCT